ncbi:hypothetical protein HOLleu_12893 [Holothuria leucospilota]|uniref:Uncharacterized protein n=1 Tax=Holothuria leucospilota TaxID=206669 RepID=A0A9Q1CBK8_HOLLE|nr:hypothetical protein HOLleu_12893 [Holothuria leucospilota]
MNGRNETFEVQSTRANRRANMVKYVLCGLLSIFQMVNTSQKKMSKMQTIVPVREIR